MNKRILSLMLIGLSFPVLASGQEEGTTGLTLEVAVSGFFSPEVTSAAVIKIDAEAPAADSGVQIGDKLVSIHECAIPGCPAKEAKQMMRRAPGEMVTLTFERPDGSRYTTDIKMVARTD